MKEDKKKTPKTSTENYLVTSDAEAILYGMLFVLLGFIGLLNKGPVGQFLTYCFVYLFGAFHVFFFLILIFLGFYLMIKKQFYRIRIDLKLLGCFLMLLAFSIGASLESGLTLQNAYILFSQRMENVQDSLFHISSLTQVPLVGGGIVGYFLAGALNSAVTEMGSKIVIIFLLITGFLLLFKNGLISTIRFISSYHKKRRMIREQARNDSQAREIEENAKKEEIKYEEFKKEISAEDNVISQRPVVNREVIPPASKLFEEVDEKEEVELTREPLKPYFDDIDLKEEPVYESRVEKEVSVTPFFDNDIEEEVREEKIEERIEEKITIDQDNEYIAPSSFEKQIVVPQERQTNQTENKPYMYPPIALLSAMYDGDKTSQNINIADEYVEKINEMFADFHIGAQVISYTIGPSVTRFDVKTNPGVKLSSIAGTQNELAVKLGGNKTVRVELIVEGKDTSGIEVGNKFPTMVPFKDCFSDLASSPKDKLLIPLGKDISGKVVKTSIDELPHLLVAGTTGSGKSIFIHSIIMTLIMRNTPEELRLLLIDPKRVEFSKYYDLPHLLCPIISDSKEATTALQRLVDEMERRYEVFATQGKGASKYSEYMEIAREYNLEKMPVIVMIVDEFADFVSTNQKEVEASIQRIAQKARAAGIYMILATQRPSVGFVSGDIKANIPSRIALSVATAMDSRVIIDEVGAETLLGKGDLLARVPLSKTLIRVQSAFVPSKDIIAVCDYIRSHSEVHYYEPFLDLKEHVAPSSFEGSAISSGRRTDLDPMHEEVKRFVIETKLASTTKIQNTFSMGFSRADYILDCLEREGVVKRTNTGRRIVVEDRINNDD